MINKKEIKVKRILFISHEFGIGGSTMSLVSLIQGLKENKNIEMEVLLPYRIITGKAGKLLKNKEISYKEMWYRKNYKFISEKYFVKFRICDLMNSLAVKRISNYIKKGKFDIVCSNSTGVDVGARAARLAKVPHIYYVREMMESGLACEFRNKKRMKNLLENSEYAIFISKTIEDYYRTNYQIKNKAQFFNGFITSDYYIERHEILKEEKIYMTQVGTFSEVKGTLNTIEMLHQLNSHGINNWTMEFVGKGTNEYIEKMRKLIAEYHLEKQVVIGEFCSDMKEKLSSKDILIMNSKAEGFGRVTVEGMLAGCLVIGRYLGGTTEIIEDRVNGIAFNEEKDFLDVIQQVINEREVYKKIAKAGQKYALEKFDYINTAKNFIRVVEECLKQKGDIDGVEG